MPTPPAPKIAACSCGTAFMAPAGIPTKEIVKAMISHWRRGHDVRSASAVSYKLVEAVANQIATETAGMHGIPEYRWAC